MISNIGILFAFGALLCWGIGDFLLQKQVRRFGDWESQLSIALIGVIVLSPFVFSDLKEMHESQYEDLAFLFLIAASFLISSLIYLESVKRGKLSVVEPIGAIEIPVSAFLAITFLGERVSFNQSVLIILLVTGLVLVSLKSHHFQKQTWIEKGALIALVSAVLTGWNDFILGLGSKSSNPLFIVWFFNLIVMIACLFYLGLKNDLRTFGRHVKQNLKPLMTVGILDNAAWAFFALAMSVLPIIIATSLSEGYIALSAILGITFNKERLGLHQKFGMGTAIVTGIILAAVI